MQIPTVKIEAKNEIGYIIINEDDFDEKTQQLVVEAIESIVEEETPTAVEIPKPKRKPGRPPLSKKENPFE